MPRQSFLLFFVLFLVMSPLPARAQVDPRRAQAEAILQEGLSLHDRNDERGALEKYQRSYAIYPSPSTLLNIARAEQLLGRSLDALRHAREALAHPLFNTQGIPIAKKLIAELEPRFARVMLKGEKGTVVSLASTEYMLPLDAPIDLEPGEIVASGALGAERYEGRVIAARGRLTVLEMKPVANAPASPSGEALGRAGDRIDEPPSSTSDGRTSPVRWLVPVGLGAIGATGVALGVVFLGEGNAANDEAKGLGVAQGCIGVTNPQCDRAEQLRSEWKTNSTISTASFITGGVFLAGAGLTALWWPRGTLATGQASVTPLVSPTQAGVRASVTF